MIASTGLKPVFPTRDYTQGATLHRRPARGNCRFGGLRDGIARPGAEGRDGELLVLRPEFQSSISPGRGSPQSEQALPSDIVVKIPDALARNSYENSFGMHFTHFDTPAGRGLMVATDEGNLIHLESPAKQTEKRIKP